MTGEDEDCGRRGREVLGMPVYSVREGRRLGQVTSLLVRWADASVVAVCVGSALSTGPAIPFPRLRLVGEDAVLVESAAVLAEPVAADALRSLDDSLRGRSVLSAGGEKVGSVTGFWISTLDGRITTYRVRPEAGWLSRVVHMLREDSFEVPAEAVQALGADALILLDEAIPKELGAIAR